jgi:hypothetical protein
LTSVLRSRHAPDVGRYAVVTYKWSSALIEAATPLGHPPVWAPFPIPTGPTLAASTQSPLGAGSYLERCELYATGGGIVTPTTTWSDVYSAAAMSVILIGEVYATGSAGIPDPRTGTDVPAAVTAAADMQVAFQGLSTSPEATLRFSTGGYVTSHAVRGPAKYGGGTPELRIGLWTTNYFDATFLGETDTWSTVHVRALWRI